MHNNLIVGYLDTGCNDMIQKFREKERFIEEIWCVQFLINK